MSAARRGRRVRANLTLDHVVTPQPTTPTSPDAPGRAPSPSPLKIVRKELDEMELDAAHRARIEDFLFKKSLFLEVEELRPGDFKMITMLGRGNGGSVLKVVHAPTNLILARKMIHLELKPEIRERILRELKVLHKCSSPNIIGFYGSFWHDGDINILMEYMDGGSLDAVLRRVGRIEEDVLAHITSKILLGLVYLRDKLNIIHRDIKPSNVLVSTDGDCKLCDFGVSGELHNSLANTFVGTRSYMSPERLKGDKYTVESDVWSLGMSLLEMATGHFPIPKENLDQPPVPIHPPPAEGIDTEAPSGGQSMAIFELLAHIVEEEPPKPPSGVFTSDFASFVDGCLQKDPTKRMTLTQLLEHPWIVKHLAKPVDMVAWVRSTMVPAELAARDAERARHAPAPH